jgi:hypothetical protein
VGRKGGCKVVPRNFLSHSSLIALVKHYNVSHLLRSLIQISITTSLPLSPTSPPFLPPSPSSVSHPHPPRAQPNPCTSPPKTSSYTHPLSARPHPSHLISSHPIPSHQYPDPATYLCSPPPILSLIFPSPTHPPNFTSMPQHPLIY